MEYPRLENMSPKMFSDKYIKKHYLEFYEYLNDKYPSLTIREQLYLFFNNMIEPNKCKICKKYTKFESFTKGYHTYCSSKCCNSDPDKIETTQNNILNKYHVSNISQLRSIKEKKKETCLKNYGVENPSQSIEIRSKIKETNLERYGVEYAQQSQIIRDKFIKTMRERYNVNHPSQLDIVKEKKKETCLKNYGVDHPSKSQIIKEKKKETCLKNYGVESPNQSEIVKQKQKDTYNTKYIAEHPDIINIYEENGERLYMCRCSNKICNSCSDKTYIINHSLYHSRNYQDIEKCTILNPVDNKGKDTGIEKFIRNILDLYNIEYINNVRLFGNLEVDIFIPSKNIAIECNGVYWHSDKIKLPKYHYNKYKIYKDNGIQLLSIWEDWIITKPEIVKSIILSKLGIYNRRIYARKCIIKEIDSKISKLFLEQNHIQGNSNNTIKYGLYYNNELVSVMTFSKKRRSMMGNREISEGEWELTRFCNLKNMQVIGGADKLLKHFIKQHNPQSVVSFASHDISNGNLYEVLGFKKQSETCGSYWYIDQTTMIRYHRYTFRKSELIKLGYDKDKSEFEIMNNLKYHRIYDSGQSKYIMQIKKDPN